MGPESLALCGDDAERLPVFTMNMWSASGTGNVRSMTAFISENIAVFAPMPRPSVSTMIVVTSAWRRSMRSAY